jgi:hypothetical protein
VVTEGLAVFLPGTPQHPKHQPKTPQPAEKPLFFLAYFS